MKFQTFCRVIFSCVSLWTSTVQARTLLVSDIDDTIKISHVLSTWQALQRSGETKVVFKGMPELYELIQRSQDVDFVYLSNAPKTWMEENHRNFLQRNQFPPGQMILRGGQSPENFKYETLKALLRKTSYSDVLLIGDNGEQDSEIYQKIARKFPGQKFFVVIRALYSVEDGGHPPLPGQFQFMNPNKLADRLAHEGFLDQNLIGDYQARVQRDMESTPVDDEYEPRYFTSWSTRE